MAEYRLGEIEMRFAKLIWDNEPIQSGELAKLAEKEFGWKKSTTYTVIKRICEKGIFKNENGVVSSLLSHSEFQSKQSTEIVDEAFCGSLPSFVAAFVSGKKLSKKDIDELQKIIDDSRKGRK